MSALRRLPAFKLTVTGIMVLFAAAFAYPVFLAVITSLKTEHDVIVDPLGLPSRLTFDAYRAVWTSLDFGRLLFNTFVYAGAGAGLALLIGIYPAYAFSRFRMPGGRAIFFLLLTTLMLPQQTALIPLYHLLSNIGLLNTRLGLIAVHAAWGFPFEMLLLTGFFASQPRELEEAARMDGATDRQILRYVVLPLALPAIGVAFVLNFVGIWKEFLFSVTFLSSQNLYPLTLGLLNLSSSQYLVSYSAPAAGVLMTTIPLILLFMFVYRWLRGGIYAGALK